ncbi:hypothetical protein [Pseudonocardia humida]|uniref:Lipoprotein n=1 Tax=Pseudonocardia humida TaxID=2800819 RepID=A0ABT1A4I9_9PSEU|nr:hypothetical protein [Pseudonocardia humida]MCO1657679.1 hypothetical protein [Pseudonocardia humida]
MSASIRRSLRATLAAALIALAVAGCGGSSSEGSNTQCALDGCTITFARGATGEVSVLGVTARLVSVDGGVATIDIAGNTVQVPVGGETTAEGFTVGLQSLTEDQAVVRVTLGGGGRGEGGGG